MLSVLWKRDAISYQYNRHKAEQEYWSQASEDLVEREVGQMAYMISKYAQIFPIEAIKVGYCDPFIIMLYFVRNCSFMRMIRVSGHLLYKQVDPGRMLLSVKWGCMITPCQRKSF